MEYNFEVVHQPGVKTQSPNALLRIPAGHEDTEYVKDK